MLFLDIETQNNWSNGESFKIKDLRISYTGVIDGATGEELDFWEDDTERLGELMKQADMVVHYNGFTFDMPVIANYVGEDILDIPQIDLMVAANKAIGFRPKLDMLTNATLGYGKSGKGSDAVVYWEAGELQKLRDYCIQDVKVTMDLYNFGKEHGYIKYHDRNGFLKEAKIDWDWGKKVVEKNEDLISMF